VTAVSSSSKMRLDYDGIDTAKGSDAMLDSNADAVDADLDALTAFLEDDFNGNRIVIDCTASQDVANRYPEWLSRGIHVVATNKKAGAGPAALWEAAKAAQLAANTQWLYETTAPGSGLPLLATLKDMTQSGDVVTRVSGRFSGSISFIFSQLQGGVPLSEALALAVDKGYCEPVCRLIEARSLTTRLADPSAFSAHSAARALRAQ